MFTNYDHGRFSVIDDGTLVIESVVKEDSGTYVCKGLSIAGSAYAKARLEVRGTTARHVFYPHDTMLARILASVCVCVCHKSVWCSVEMDGRIKLVFGL